MIKLLMVDDEPFIPESIRGMLDWKEMEIKLLPICTNAFSALEVMKDNMPDILLADVRMPGMSGLELIERARTLFPGLSCIVLSAYDDFEYARRAMRAGTEEYLLKPCSLEEIQAALLRARDLILKKRAELSEGASRRREQVFQLAARLTALPPENGVITARQVEEVCRGIQDDMLLQEAMIYMMTYNDKEFQEEWSMHTLRSLYAPMEKLYGHCADMLTRLLGSQDKRGNFVQQMKDYVQRHYGMENLSLQYLADNLVFMSADYIGKEFIKATGMKFSSYLLSVRMEQAKYLIITKPEMHSYEIAEQVGLGHNPRYFSQLFKKYTGVTPSEYGKN